MTECKQKMHLVDYDPEYPVGPDGFGWNCERCGAYVFDPFAGWWDAADGVVNKNTGEVMKQPA